MARPCLLWTSCIHVRQKWVENYPKLHIVCFVYLYEKTDELLIQVDFEFPPQRIRRRAAGSINWSLVCSCSTSRTCETYQPDVEEKKEWTVLTEEKQ